MRSALNGPAAIEALRQSLRHVYWIGGASGSGKSTIARRLAERYGMQVYDTDAVMPNHARRTEAEETPYLARFAAMDMDERWVNRTPREMLDTFHWFHGEKFSNIIEDLLRLPADQLVIAEGFRLLPDLVQPLLADPRHAVWLLPSPQFRQAVFEARGGIGWAFIAKTSHPGRALDNLLQRDVLFTDRLAEQIRQLELTALSVDATISETVLERQVAAAFGFDD
jgi:hypothetical protein